MPEKTQWLDFIARKATAHGINLDIMVDATGRILKQKSNKRERKFILFSNSQYFLSYGQS
jgi:hypothetical protein